MHIHKRSLVYTMRFLAVVLLVLGNLFLLSLVPHVVNANGSDTTDQPAQRYYVSDDPNVVADGISAALHRAGRALDVTGRASGNLLSSMTNVAASVGTTTGTILVNGASFVGHGFVGGLSFVASIPSNLVGSVTSTSVVSAAIKPSVSSPTPVIDPYAANLKAGALLATEQTSSPQLANVKADDQPAWPIHGNITTLFGVPHWPYQPTHTGLDISDGKRSGVTPIKPYRPGTVVNAIRSNVGLGNHVIIDHGEGITSLYGHLASLSVQPGQVVDKGSVLGFEGSTGASTGTHLHFEIRIHGQVVDPRAHISAPL